MKKLTIDVYPSHVWGGPTAEYKVNFENEYISGEGQSLGEHDSHQDAEICAIKMVLAILEKTND